MADATLSAFPEIEGRQAWLVAPGWSATPRAVEGPRPAPIEADTLPALVEALRASGEGSLDLVLTEASLATAELDPPAVDDATWHLATAEGFVALGVGEPGFRALLTPGLSLRLSGQGPAALGALRQAGARIMDPERTSVAVVDPHCPEHDSVVPSPDLAAARGAPGELVVAFVEGELPGVDEVGDLLAIHPVELLLVSRDTCPESGDPPDLGALVEEVLEQPRIELWKGPAAEPRLVEAVELPPPPSTDGVTGSWLIEGPGLRAYSVVVDSAPSSPAGVSSVGGLTAGALTWGLFAVYAVGVVVGAAGLAYVALRTSS